MSSNDTTAALIAAPQAGLAETATSAQAAQAQARTLARYAMAERHPRNMIDVRTRLLRECDRPGFAGSARYDIPFKKWNPETRRQEVVHVIGASIRFAEAAARLMTNVDVSTMVTWDDDSKRVTAVQVTDLETNTSYTKDVVTEKVIEKKFLPKGMKPIRARPNAYGDTIHLVPATEQEVVKIAAAGVSKAIRDCVLRLLPGDILEECLTQIAATAGKADAEDPDAAAKAIAGGFNKLGVSAAQLEELLGHSLEGASLAELAQLRGYWKALDDGVTNWSDLLEIVAGKAPAEGEPDPLAKERTEIQKMAQEQIHKMKTGGKKRGRGRAKAEKPADKAPPPREPGDDGDKE